MKKVILFICLIILLVVGVGRSYVDVTPVSNMNFEYNEGLIYSLESLPDTIRPSESLNKGEEDLVSNIFSGLVEVNEKGEPIPDLAMGWTLSDDGLEYTFKINEKNKWSNGTEVTAKDFQIFFRDLLSPDNEDYTSNELYSIYGVKDYREGKIDFSEVAISSPDDYTLVLRMNNKDDDLLKNLAKPIYRLRDLNEPLDNYKKDFNEISYTGPYVIYDVTKDGFIRLKDNPYNSSELEIKDIAFKEKDSDEIELAAFNLEKVDILKNPPIIYSEDIGLYKDLSKYNSDVLKLMIVNSDKAEMAQGISNIMQVLISDSNILKNNLGKSYIKVINNKDEIHSIKNEGDKGDYKISESEKNNLKESGKNTLKKVINNNEVLKIVVGNNEEDKALANELKKFLDKELSIKSIVKIHEDDIEEIIKSGEFNIAFGEFNLNEKNSESLKKEDIDKEEGEVEDKSEEGEKETATSEKSNLSLVSLYFKNDVWCKSPKVNYLFIDSNGNLILKYSS
ncbi:ABC transporter substrate-binding protein [Clostridium perfringens]|uniref:ABC transporter substrate-binding protein n=1 Tax=Clostridium perfringens TaxID=1502 RepID=UPI0013E2E2A0|nr:ABC transporter substrate-binding protein [Clostridium perfringens]MDK0550044.1 ABC transporter substrate-binding protein [Clostridium perfringens]MDK0554297.1 ABC transporter substrate-binding protein [Clostridium perfringens]MDK0835361.1 ABC transporter substrate-binding protein [Clostridium perfringens]MDK0936346.1 ABC transporter substrate-binding protein [Clostridium perfringens]NGU12043.1 peptide-binding protein [Clostridium perfringens]